ARGDLDLVFGAAGGHERHAVLHGVVHAAVSAVGDEHVGERQQPVVGQVGGDAHIGGVVAHRDVAAAGRDHDEHVVVGKAPDGGVDQRGGVGVGDGALGDMHHGSGAVEVAPPLGQLDRGGLRARHRAHEV